jgi:hypothetical protein
MSEVLKELDLAAGYGGTIRGPGVQVPAYEADPWHKYADRLIDRLAEAVANAAACELYVDDGGPLIFGVRPGLIRNGDTLYTFAGCTAALTDDATNYIYLDADDLAAGNTVTVNQTGFPLQSVTPHIPLGTIVAADGAYTHDNIDQTARQRSMLILGAAMTAANANMLVGGAASVADALHIHGLGGLDTGVRGMMPVLVMEGANHGDGTGAMSIQAADPYGAGPLPARYRVRTWISASLYGAPAAQTDFSIITGTQLRQITADADYEAISDEAGLVVMNIVAGNGTYHVMAEADGAIYSAEITITGN